MRFTGACCMLVNYTIDEITLKTNCKLHFIIIFLA